jgi:hypothetical protein
MQQLFGQAAQFAQYLVVCSSLEWLTLLVLLLELLTCAVIVSSIALRDNDAKHFNLSLLALTH